jgi:hypothetical protein
MAHFAFMDLRTSNIAADEDNKRERRAAPKGFIPHNIIRTTIHLIIYLHDFNNDSPRRHPGGWRTGVRCMELPVGKIV